MTSPLRDQLDAAMTEVRAYQEKLLAARREAGEATVSVRSKDRMFTVTLGGQGELRDIKFHTTDYGSMPPAQLSALLVETVNSAREQLAAKVRATFEPLSGVGTALRTSMTGGSELDGVLGPLREMLRPPGDEGKDGRPPRAAVDDADEEE